MFFCKQGVLRIFADKGGGFLRTSGGFLRTGGRLRNVPEVLRGNCDLLNVPRGACTFFPEYSARHYNIYTDGRKDKLLYGTEGYAGLYIKDMPDYTKIFPRLREKNHPDGENNMKLYSRNPGVLFPGSATLLQRGKTLLPEKG